MQQKIMQEISSWEMTFLPLVSMLGQYRLCILRSNKNKFWMDKKSYKFPLSLPAINKQKEISDRQPSWEHPLED